MLTLLSVIGAAIAVACHTTSHMPLHIDYMPRAVDRRSIRHALAPLPACRLVACARKKKAGSNREQETGAWHTAACTGHAHSL
jgi:hypothetical protein